MGILKTCPQCNKRIFILTSSGVCLHCAENNELIALARADREQAERKKIDTEAAYKYIEEMGCALSSVQDVIYPALGRERIKEIMKAAKFASMHIFDWKDNPEFSEAFFGLFQKSGALWCFDKWGCSLIKLEISDFESWANKKAKTLKDILSKCYLALLEAYDDSKIYRVAGVTFKNGRRSRQTILRQIRFRDPPYAHDPDITLRRYKYEEEDAVGVWVNDEQVGNISKHEVPDLIARWDEYAGVTEYDIHGGGLDRSYGMDIKVIFRKQ